MCLLICKPEGQTLSRNEIRNALISNPHGVGIAYPEDGLVKIRKGLWNFERTDEELTAVEHLPLIVHFRYATHGVINDTNAHPFDLANGWAMAHNGIIDIPTSDDESDTRAFVRKVINPMVLEDPELLSVDESFNKFNELIEPMIGWSRLAFMSPNGDIRIVNEEAGSMIDGVWFSNRNHLISYSPPCYAGHKSASRPWREIDEDWNNYVVGDGAEREVEDDDELRFMEFNANKLTCDMCGQKVKGRFTVDRDYGMLFCSDCHDK